MFENRVLRGIFGPKRDKATREGRKLHNEKVNDLYCSPNIVWVIKWRKTETGRACSTRGERKGVDRVLVGIPKGKRLLGRPWRRWANNITVFRMWVVGVWTGSSWLRIGTVGGHL